jgi:hypothetical protein
VKSLGTSDIVYSNMAHTSTTATVRDSLSSAYDQRLGTAAVSTKSGTADINLSG